MAFAWYMGSSGGPLANSAHSYCIFPFVDFVAARNQSPALRSFRTTLAVPTSFLASFSLTSTHVSLLCTLDSPYNLS